MEDAEEIHWGHQGERGSWSCKELSLGRLLPLAWLGRKDDLTFQVPIRNEYSTYFIVIRLEHHRARHVESLIGTKACHFHTTWADPSKFSPIASDRE
jgi:hypothetical protein